MRIGQHTRNLVAMATNETTVEVAGRSIRITSPDKVMFPEQGWTKLNVVEHYLMCASGALRGVRNRPSAGTPVLRSARSS